MAPERDIDTPDVGTPDIGTADSRTPAIDTPVRTKLWVPADRGGMPMIELAVPWVSRMTKSGFRARLARRVAELARRSEADTGTVAARLAAGAFAKSNVAAPPLDAIPGDVATRLMDLPATARVLERIDWSRSPAKAGASAGLPANAWQQYRHLTLADFLALL